MQKFTTTAPIAALLDVPAGLIRFIAADRAETTVEVRPANAAKGRDVKAAERIEVGYADGVLRIVAREAESRMLGNSGAVEVTVQLPSGSRVEAKAADAELRGAGRLGDVVFDGARATVELAEATEARITVQAGDVTVGRLNGPATVTVQQGDIRIAEAVHGEVMLTTQSGDITVGAARGVSASLDAGTSYGRIQNSLRNTEGAADLRIRATTSYGDITARSI
ncbi:DUF4097 family beta strand repeat-containing protein [Kitasatospora sp. NPDC093558]|uniref:DUF4097 family beta strand repeat-containing protein n=1 Tax=Kitasatospora sp. NPDC093558 TaxID=3155201 RepID=UPI0034341050